MIKKWSSFFLVTLLIVSVFLAACQPQPTVAPTVPAKTKTLRELQNGKPFRMVIPVKNHPVHRLMQAGYWAACKDMDALCDPLLMDDFTEDTYIAKMESAISLGSSGLVMNLGAPWLYKPGQDLAKAFPTISVHSVIDKKDIPDLLAWVSANPVSYAKQAAAKMAELIGCKGVVAVMQSGKSDTENAVGDTFGSELKKLCPAVVVLPTQMETVEPVTATAADAAVIAAHPDLRAAFSTTGGGPTSWATALKEAGKKPGDVIIGSMDYSLPNLDLLKQGWVSFLVGQPLYEEFYQATIMLADKLMGKSVKYENELPAPILTAKDADKYIEINRIAGNSK